MSQQLIGEPPGRITPLDEFVNTLEVELMAQRKLTPALFKEIAGSYRQAFDRITFRPRLMVPTTMLDLSLNLFGQSHFAPILSGPACLQQRFHPDGELATARGAAAAQAGLVVAQQSSYSLDKIAPLTNMPLWVQLDPAAPAVLLANAKKAMDLGAKVICLIQPAKLTVPWLLKGVMTPKEAQIAIQQGAAGIIVSNYRRPGLPSAIAALPAIAAEVAGKIPILIDGSFRRGADVLKALALGARAALVTRPPLWGLATYGDRGVQQVMEMLQSELARDMAMCGLQNLSQVTPAYVKVHQR